MGLLPQANADAACALVSALATRVSHAVVSPGSRNTPVILALDAHSSIDVHVILDERVAGFAALGLARASGAPVLLSCTSGSAGAHYLPAIIEAYESSAPLIVITADRPPELHGHAAAQTTDQGALFGNHVLDEFTLPLPDEAGPESFETLAHRALSLAVRESRPVHLNAPFREPLWDPETLYAPRASGAPGASPPTVRAEVRPALDVLRAERGLVIVGPRDRQDRLHDESSIAESVNDLATRLGWPVLADITSGARYCDAAAPITGYDSLLRSTRFAESMVPDSVLVVGRPSTSKKLNQWLNRNRVPAVVVGEIPSHRDPNLRVLTELRGDTPATLKSLIESIPPRETKTQWQAEWKHSEAVFLECSRQDENWWEGALARTVLDSLPSGALLHLSSSMAIRDADAFAGPLSRAVTVTSNRGVNGIDGIVATALGQAKGWSHGPVLATVGDLAFLHDLGAVRLAATDMVALTLIVVNNRGGRIFDFLPIREHPSAFDRYFLTDQGVDLEAACRGFGAEHSRVNTIADLRAALEASLARGRFNVIEALFDGDRNRMEHDEFHRRVTEALA